MKAAQVILRVALVVVAVTLSGIALLIFAVVVNVQAGWIAGAVAFLSCGIAWAALPLVARMTQGRR